MARKPQTKPAAEPKSGLEKVEASVTPSSVNLEGPIEGQPPDDVVARSREPAEETTAQPPITPQASPTYREHQGEWESKKEIEARSRELRSRQEFADLAKHPKFDKFKSHGGK